MITDIFKKLYRRLDLIVAHGKIEKSGPSLQATFNESETFRSIPHYSHYGFSSKPPQGTDAVFVSNGTRDSLVCIGEVGPYQEELKPSETCIYADKTRITLSPDGTIQINGDHLKIQINGKNPILLLVSAIEDLSKSIIIVTPSGNGQITPSASLAKTLQEIRSLCVE